MVASQNRGTPIWHNRSAQGLWMHLHGFRVKCSGFRAGVFGCRFLGQHPNHGKPKEKDYGNWDYTALLVKLWVKVAS